ncbi:gamma-glutamylcyclotransferase family protein [Sinimarinibacterium flocculans]|uniref:gamma-glutamylcyclotransferase family protein n=1 Tax=Sinimarinibacterium flocculans TaxID=985250 RepID=UPI0035186993
MSGVTLFVYGSLLAPSVLHALLDRAPVSLPARLPDYRRSALRGQRFPGIVPSAGAQTSGALIEVSRRELQWIDAWEDDFFERRRVRVLADRAGGHPVQAYVLAPRYRHLLAARGWCVDDFARRHAPACAEAARRWRRDRDPGLRHTTAQSPPPPR